MTKLSETFTVNHRVIDDEPNYVYEVYEYRFKNWDNPYHDEGIDICVYPDHSVCIRTYLELDGAEVDDEYLSDLTDMVGAAIVHADKLRNEAK